RDPERALNIPDLIKEGTIQYGMQSFDQSLMQWYQKGEISYEMALFYATNPNEFALRISGIEGTSDRTFAEEVMERKGDSSGGLEGLTQ
ncbi:MAG: type IV pili twitching motility protein PilT, partial [Gemmatimonadota bacterium]|nr:type IV pili twitching motility protein PilT [Gemmatimonadota bacterium]